MSILNKVLLKHWKECTNQRKSWVNPIQQIQTLVSINLKEIEEIIFTESVILCNRLG
jgi:hypothetical protein